MPRPSKKKKSGDKVAEADNKCFRFHNECLELKCNWNDCREVFLDMLDLVWHVEMHIEKRGATDDLSCQWNECGYLASCKQEFTVHVNFHAFHTKIKCIGANIIARKKVKDCSLETQDRNLVPELPLTLNCAWRDCEQKTFDNPELYYRHVGDHAFEVWRDKLQCKWDGCMSHFNASYRLREHLRSHTQERMIGCPNCGRLFSNRTKFLDHLKRQTPVDEQKYRCSHCSKMLASERLLRDHMRNHINSYKCPSCDMTCSNPSNLINHIKYRHSEVRPFNCTFCDYKGKTQSDLYKHLQSHMPKPQNVCQHKGCGFTSRTGRAFRQHLGNKHGASPKIGAYVCHLCDKQFQRGSYLTHHLMKKHGFRWPSGHCRFRYKQNDDGSRQLQTIRYESIELTEEMINRDVENLLEIDADDVVEVNAADVDSEESSVNEINVDEVVELVEDPHCASTSVADESKDPEQIVMLTITGSDGIARNVQFVTPCEGTSPVFRSMT